MEDNTILWREMKENLLSSLSKRLNDCCNVYAEEKEEAQNWRILKYQLDTYLKIIKIESMMLEPDSKKEQKNNGKKEQIAKARTALRFKEIS